MEYEKNIPLFIKELNNDRKSPQTIRAYEETLNEFFNEYLPNFKNKQLTTEKIKGFTQWKEQKANQRKKIGIKGIGIGREMKTNRLSAASINRYNSALRQFLLYCGELKLAKEIKMLKKQQDYDTIEYQDIKKIFDEQTIRGFYNEKNYDKEKEDFYVSRFTLLLDFVFYTGLRAQEVFDTKKTDLKLEREVPVIEIVGKGNKKRLIELSKEWIREYRHFMGKNPKLAASEYIFTSIDGNRLAYSTLKSYIKQLGHYIGVPALSIHKLRHAYAIKTLEENKDDQTALVKLSKRLGHDDINTTMIYLSKMITSNTALKSPTHKEDTKK